MVNLRREDCASNTPARSTIRLRRGYGGTGAMSRGDRQEPIFGDDRDPCKVALARELRSRTTMPLAWIAERLWMGRRGYLAWLVGRREKLSGASPAGQAVLPL